MISARRGESAVDEIAAGRDPVLIALAAAELQAEQHLAALQRHAPRPSTALAGASSGRSIRYSAPQNR